MDEVTIVWGGKSIKVTLKRSTTTHNIYVDHNNIEYEVWHEDPEPGVPG